MLVPLFMFIHYLITLHVDVIPAWEIALAMVTTSYIWRHVDPDRPARTVIRTALTDWRGAARSPATRSGPRGWSPAGSRSGRRSCDPDRTRGAGSTARSRPLDPDFADYYDDAPVSGPALLRAPTPLGGVRRSAGRRPIRGPTRR